MRRLLLLVVVAVLVNLPWVHEAYVDHRISAEGRDVRARVVKHQSVRGRDFVSYRLPSTVDPGRRTYGARLDATHFADAVRTGVLEVRVVPGHPSENRPAGEVGSDVFVVIALVGDLILGLVIAVAWWRRRRWSRRLVVAIDGDLVTFTLAGATLTARTDWPLLDGLAVGGHVRGRLVLVAETDVLPAGPVGEVEHLGGGRYRLRGRVSDVSRTHTDLRLESGLVLLVRSGDHRNRADLREPAEVTGTLTLSHEMD